MKRAPLFILACCWGYFLLSTDMHTEQPEKNSKQTLLNKRCLFNLINEFSKYNFNEKNIDTLLSNCNDKDKEDYLLEAEQFAIETLHDPNIAQNAMEYLSSTKKGYGQCLQAFCNAVDKNHVPEYQAIFNGCTTKHPVNEFLADSQKKAAELGLTQVKDTIAETRIKIKHEDKGYSGGDVIMAMITTWFIAWVILSKTADASEPGQSFYSDEGYQPPYNPDYHYE